MSEPRSNPDGPAVRVELALELGRTRLTIAELMALREGSLIELGVASGEPAVLTISRAPFAEAEVVAVADRFGARILRVVGDGRSKK